MSRYQKPTNKCCPRLPGLLGKHKKSYFMDL